MKMTASIEINRPIDQVFAFVVNMEHLPTWARAVMAAQRTTSGPDDVGTTYRITGRALGRAVGSTYRLTAYAPPSTFAATGAIGPFPLREDYTFTTTAGGTQVQVVSELEPRGVVRAVAPVLRPLLARVIQSDLGRLKRQLETGA